MQAMTVELISLNPTAEAGRMIARGRARVIGSKTRIWIELHFVPEQSDAWDEAYGHLLDLLDIA